MTIPKWINTRYGCGYGNGSDINYGYGLGFSDGGGTSEINFKDIVSNMLSVNEDMSNFKLCYIDIHSKTAYFTTQDISVQWGDNWNELEYEHNAGEPHEALTSFANGTPKWEIYKLKFDGDDFSVPDPDYSVRDINNGAVPWISMYDFDENFITINAGDTIDEFKHKMKQAKNTIYILEE